MLFANAVFTVFTGVFDVTNCVVRFLGQTTCPSFTGKSVNGGISRRHERTKTGLKTTWSKDSSDYSKTFQIEKRLAL